MIIRVSITGVVVGLKELLFVKCLELNTLLKLVEIKSS